MIEQLNNQSCKALHCRSCGKELLMTDGERLYFSSSAWTREPTAVYCGCGARRFWRPVVPVAQQSLVALVSA